MSYFDVNTIFDPRNLDTDYLQEEMDFYKSIYEWYAHQSIMDGNKADERSAIKAYAISQTLKAVLCLCADRSNQELFNKILDEMCPIKRTEKVSVYEFRG